jgi:hypothetical protein
MGGVGKTTLARYYAHLCNYPIVWEINAETRESLLNSFNDFALALAQTKEQKNALELIQGSQNAEYKEKQLLCFVKNCLKQYATWLLLYDNVENFTAIKPYLADDVGWPLRGGLGAGGAIRPGARGPTLGHARRA